jgi:hypothetical protein
LHRIQAPPAKKILNKLHTLADRAIQEPYTFSWPSQTAIYSPSYVTDLPDLHSAPKPGSLVKSERCRQLQIIWVTSYSMLGCALVAISSNDLRSFQQTSNAAQGRWRSVKVNMSLENVFGITAVAIEVAVVALLVYRRVWRMLPVFFVYCIWALISDALAFSIRLFSSNGYGFKFYTVVTVLDFALQFCVLVELAWSVLLPVRKSLSRKALWLVAALLLAVGSAIWPFAGLSGVAVSSKAFHFIEQLQQTASILRVLFFLFLAGCSHFLSLGWRDRELQVATGFGFYSLVSLAVAALNTHQSTPQQINHLYLMVVASFLSSLLYWIFSFAQAEAERREFTPQMQSMLLSLAGTARISRVALTDFAVAESQSSER